MPSRASDERLSLPLRFRGRKESHVFLLHSFKLRFLFG
jgi:hypothetical protein